MPASDVNVSAEFGQFVRYARAGGAGYETGASWDDASPDIQTLMDELEAVTISGYSGPYIVKVGAGTYRPQYKPTNDPANAQGTAVVTPSPDDRDSVFVLRKRVQVWGGYPASGGDDASRDIAAHRTILSGDLNNNTTVDSGDAYHVVLGAGIDNTTVLDGLTISGGNANGGNFDWSSVLGGKTLQRSRGGGMYHGLASSPSLPVLINVTVSGNSAGEMGGGIYSNASSAPVLVNVLISGNTSGYSGGGMGIMAYSSPVLTNVTVSGNYAFYAGGGINSENSAWGIWNSVIWGNDSGTVDKGIHVYNNTLTIGNSIVQDSGGSFAWTVSNATDSGSNLDADPSFVGPDPAADNSPTAGGDYRLNSGPAVDTGDSSKYPDTWAKWQSLVGTGSGITTEAEYDLHIAPHLTGDLAGNTRKQGAAIDMGAYETE
jgi:predicted outer membrane repeat protein